jgi:hypothetical protein
MSQTRNKKVVSPMRYDFKKHRKLTIIYEKSKQKFLGYLGKHKTTKYAVSLNYNGNDSFQKSAASFKRT